MKKQTITKISSILLLVMMVSVLFTLPFTASAADPQKVEKSYDIAVVYDNSGSMYWDESWCRAKYAMEIFASMLDYSKDKLTIFPMWGVTTDGTKPDDDLEGNYRGAVQIKSKADIDKISKMYTVSAQNTPFAPVNEAYDYLKSSSADEKWLIVLTDGAFDAYTRGEQISKFDPTSDLLKLSGRGIKIQYLGLGNQAKIDPNKADADRQFYIKNTSGEDLKDNLIEICNFIFQRSILPDNCLDGNKLTLDLSMKNLIVFVQGDGAEVISLTDSGGSTIGVTLNSGQRKYSEIRAGGTDGGGNSFVNAPIDYSLAGHVVTFAACPKGEYTLNYTGDRDKIQIFYEPDVDMVVTLLDSEGNEVDADSDFYAGEYTIVSKIVDGTTGEDVTNHKLLGNDVVLKTYITVDGKTKEYDNGATIEFLPETQVDIVVEGTYLEGKYKLSSADDASLNWLRSIDVKKADFGLRVELICEEDWLVLKEHDKWQPIKAVLYMDGEPLTKEQMAVADLSVEIDNGLKYRIEKLPDESAYNIYISQDENGDYIEPATGKYVLKAQATFTDEYGEAFKSKAQTVDFKIKAYAWFWIPIIILIIILALLGLFWFIATRKYMPRKINKETASFSVGSSSMPAEFVELDHDGRTITIKGPDVANQNHVLSASFSLEPIDPLFKRPKGVRVVDISAESDIEVSINGVRYVCVEGTWVMNAEARQFQRNGTCSPIAMDVPSGGVFRLSRSRATVSCTIDTN